MMTWHSVEILTRVKATPCGAVFGLPETLPLFASSSSSSFFLREQRGFQTFSLSLSLQNFCYDSHSVLSHQMEHNLRRDLHLELSDPEPLDPCRTELTPTNSDSSAITEDASKDVFHHGAAPFPQDQLTKWTDQQHSLYLNSLEASFVNELYHSMQLCGWSVQNNLKEAYKSRTLQKSYNISGQFLILQDGCWKKINHERNEPKLESTADSHDLAGSPLRFTSVAKGCATREFAGHQCGLICDGGHIRGSSVSSSKSPRSSGKQCVCHACYLESVGCTSEVTDQNFKDEDHEARSSCAPMEKRLKTAPG